MPTYTFKCAECVEPHLVRLSFADYEDVKAKDKLVICEGHEKPMDIMFNPGQMGFVLKDGISGGWPSKAMKENKFRKYRRGVVAKREKDHVFKSRLIPNYQGKEAHSWRDVQDHVRTEMGVDSAKTYNRLVATEVHR